MDFVAPVVFPDYKIAVDTPETKITIPDLLPSVNVLPDSIKIPAMHSRLSDLGHAGVAIIQGTTGLARYFEYGRYDVAARGETRTRKVPNVHMGPHGRPTRDSFVRLLAVISKEAGQKGTVSGALIELPKGKFEIMLKYALARAALNHTDNREPYKLTSNSCMHFSKAVAESADVKMPWIFDPRPVSFIEEVQASYPSFKFVPPKTFTATGIPGY